MYRVEFRPAALRSLKRLDATTAARIRGAVALLAAEPRPPSTMKMSGRDAYRLRVGDYRVIYTIQDAVLLIVVVQLGHRSSIYK